MQRDERGLDRFSFLTMQPNPLVKEVGVEAVAQGDICDGGARFGALLNDLGFEGLTVGTALRGHEKSA